MTKDNIGKVLVEAVKSDFKVAQDALDGAKVADNLAKKETDEAKKRELESLKQRFIQISQQASTNATTTSSIGPVFTQIIRSSSGS